MDALPRQAAFQLPGEHLILYDGVCGLCNRLNRFVLAHDQRRLFDFASLQSELGESVVRGFRRSSADLDTFYLVVNYRSRSPGLLNKSRAALAVLGNLNFPWCWLAVLKVLPWALLDAIYDFIARHRYRIFGRLDSCTLPAPQHLHALINSRSQCSLPHQFNEDISKSGLGATRQGHESPARR